MQRSPFLVVEVVAIDDAHVHLGPIGEVRERIEDKASAFGAGFEGLHRGIHRTSA